MANLVKHFIYALVLLSLTAGIQDGVEGATCETPVEFASCVKDHPSSCVNICRSGLYFPPYLLIRSVCDQKFLNGHFLYYCKCLWECDSATAAAASARPPLSPLQPPIAQ